MRGVGTPIQSTLRISKYLEDMRKVNMFVGLSFTQRIEQKIKRCPFKEKHGKLDKTMEN